LAKVESLAWIDPSSDFRVASSIKADANTLPGMFATFVWAAVT
jgi:hypothetical protein